MDQDKAQNQQAKEGDGAGENAVALLPYLLDQAEQQQRGGEDLHKTSLEAAITLAAQEVELKGGVTQHLENIWHQQQQEIQNHTSNIENNQSSLEAAVALAAEEVELKGGVTQHLENVWQQQQKIQETQNNKNGNSRSNLEEAARLAEEEVRLKGGVTQHLEHLWQEQQQQHLGRQQKREAESQEDKQLEMSQATGQADQQEGTVVESDMKLKGGVTQHLEHLWQQQQQLRQQQQQQQANQAGGGNMMTIQEEEGNHHPPALMAQEDVSTRPVVAAAGEHFAHVASLPSGASGGTALPPGVRESEDVLLNVCKLREVELRNGVSTSGAHGGNGSGKDGVMLQAGTKTMSVPTTRAQGYALDNDNDDGLSPMPRSELTLNAGVEETRPGAYPVRGIDARSSEFLVDMAEEDEEMPTSIEVAGPEEEEPHVSAVLVADDDDEDDDDEDTENCQDDPESPFFRDPSTRSLRASRRRSSTRHRSTRSLQDLEEVLDVQQMPPPKEITMTEDRAPKSNMTSWIAMLVFFVVALVVTVGLALGLPVSNNSNTNKSVPESTASETMTSGDDVSPTPSPTEFIVYPPFDEESQEALVLKAIREDPNSAQYRANLWMLQDPYLDTYPYWQKLQRFALAVRYYAFGGENWFRNDHWLSYEINECEWFSKHPEDSEYPVCDEEGHYLSTNLTNNNLHGTIQKGFWIKTLRVLDVSHNRIYGQHPALVGGGDMEFYIMSNNSISGVLTAEAGIGDLRLRVVKLDSNQYEGNIHLPPSGFADTLTEVNITGNNFGPYISPTWGYFGNLTYLGLGHNNFGGSIPTELGLLTALEEMDLSGNYELTGTVPESFQSLSTLAKLDISETLISGSIPADLCQSDTEVVANCSNLDCC